MKIQPTVVSVLIALLLLLLKFILCAPPTRPDFPPHIQNSKNFKTEGIPKLGDKFIMYIEVKSKNPITYRWYKDSVIIRDAANDSFDIDSLKSEDEGVYECEVSALSASVFSNPYKLQIKRDNQEFLLENNGMVFPSGTPQLEKPFFLYIKPNIKPINDLPLTIQWYKNFEPIKEATNDTLPFWPVSNTDQGNFYCEVKHDSRIERTPPRLEYSISNDTITTISDTYLGKKLIITTRTDWDNERILKAYHSQYAIEHVFRNMKDRKFGVWWPMNHWTNQKIQIHGLYCTIAVLIRSLIYRRIRKNNIKISFKRMLEELKEIREVVNIYKAKKNKQRTGTVLTKNNEIQQKLMNILKIPKKPQEVNGI